MVLYLSFVTFLIILIFASLLITIFRKNNIKKGQPLFWFILFIISALVFLSFKLIMLIISPSLNLEFVSKFDGNTDYLIYLTLGIIANFAINFSLIFIILTGLSFKKISKFNIYISIFVILVLIALNLFIQVESVSYSNHLGWSYKLDSNVTFYNIFILLYVLYYIFYLIRQRKEIKNPVIKSKFNSFIIGVSIMLIAGIIDYLIIQKIFGQLGIDIMALAVGSIILYSTFKTN